MPLCRRQNDFNNLRQDLLRAVTANEDMTHLLNSASTVLDI